MNNSDNELINKFIESEYNSAFNFVKLGYYDAFEEKLENGFDINKENKVGQNMLTQMFCCPSKNRQAVMLYLIKKGITINYIDGENRTALFLACVCKIPKIVQALIEKGADPKLGMDMIPCCLSKETKEIRDILHTSPLLSEEQRNMLLETDKPPILQHKKRRRRK